MLTDGERKTYQFIQNFIAQKNYPPKLQEIAHGLGIQSRSTIHRWIQGLVREGLIAHLPGRHRGIRLTQKAYNQAKYALLPLLGKIAAGKPIEAIPNQEQFDLNSLFSEPGLFALKVAGDSMIDEGIFDGDWVICQSAKGIRSGDIVVALIDQQEATLKRYQPNPDSSITLLPANRYMQPMTYEANRITLQGALVGQIRRYS